MLEATPRRTPPGTKKAQKTVYTNTQQQQSNLSSMSPSVSKTEKKFTGQFGFLDYYTTAATQ
jgi:hypothetical protein